MGNYTAAGKISDFPEGKPNEVVIDGHEILLAQVGGKFHAVSNRCLHLNGKLSGGTLDGTVITCPRHSSQFDIKDGSVVRWLKGSGIVASVVKTIKQSKTLRTYPVKVEDGTVLIEV
ncbi:MAG: Rieske (2Fe-2S) protein [Dehalococcoidia bacterium]|jgi:3-phenylpropionate/trans-cinnamate dioxygenase ferredoxin subunit